MIREINEGEYSLLKEFTYLAVFVPQGVKMPPETIVELPELKVYYQDFGTRSGDVCFVSVIDSEIVGAVWTRIVNDFAHIDDDTPSLAISVKKDYRGKGIGTELLKIILDKLAEKGFSQVSLSVQKENFALNMYKKSGFSVVKDNGAELVMVKKL